MSAALVLFPKMQRRLLGQQTKGDQQILGREEITPLQSSNEMTVEDQIAARIELRRRWIAGEPVKFPVYEAPENDVKHRPAISAMFPFRCKCGAKSRTKICSRCELRPVRRRFTEVSAKPRSRYCGA
jgi:hypothetical protein